MKSFLALLLVILLLAPALADIPSRRLDGSFSKQPLHLDEYPFTTPDFRAAGQNPYHVGVKKYVGENDPEFAAITEGLKPRFTDEEQAKFQKEWVQEVRREYELTEKEKETVAAYPDEFPTESRLGKRLVISRILRLGEKEYSCSGTRFLGRGDWNGDGRDEIFLRYDDGATHAGAQSQIRVYSSNGDFVWYCNLMTIYMGWCGVLDTDRDGRVELVINPGDDHGFIGYEKLKKGYYILGCPPAGKRYDEFSGAGKGNSDGADFIETDDDHGSLMPMPGSRGPKRTLEEDRPAGLPAFREE